MPDRPLLGQLGGLQPFRPPDVCASATGHRLQAVRDGSVDGVSVPIPHFGVVLLMEDWKSLAERLEKRADIDWIERPMIRFKGEPGEQATLFIRDPSGNALEFKGFASLDQVFAH